MENRKIIRHMQAFKYGIIYYSPTGEKACMTALEPNGKIEKTLIALTARALPSNFIFETELEDTFSYFKVLLFDIFLIFSTAYLKNIHLFCAACIFSLFVSLKFFHLLHIIYHMKIKKDYNGTARFVAASHMATNAYRKLQRIPTLEEAKKASRFSSESRIVFRFANILSQLSYIVVFSFASIIGIGPYTCLLITIGFVIAINILSIFGFFNFLQIFVTEKPTDEELKVAIEGIKCFEEMEKNVKVEISN